MVRKVLACHHCCIISAYLWIVNLFSKHTNRTINDMSATQIVFHNYTILKNTSLYVCSMNNTNFLVTGNVCTYML